jgi:UDP-N-acetylglucosamine:LPS N-acetylglucosamine transferase
LQIAVMAEITPAKTLIPVIEKLNVDIIGLTHGHGADELLSDYCNELYHIGESRGGGAQKPSNTRIAALVLRDILTVVKSLSGKKIDLLITCGNAGDVRKGISAAKILRIPTLHLEQDIYNPIEMIAFSNLITVPTKHYQEFMKHNYGLKNIKVIDGYPMASYVNEMEIKEANWLKERYNVDDYLILVLGGDLKGEDIPNVIRMVEKIEKDVFIAPFRFDPDFVRNLVRSPRLEVFDGFVDLLSIIKASSGLIYGAGMGMTIEAGVLEIPSLKIAGFHQQHASVELARELGIPVVEIEEIPNFIDDLKSPNGKWLIDGGKQAVTNLVSIINNFEHEKGKSSGFGSFRKIWQARSKFR